MLILITWQFVVSVYLGIQRSALYGLSGKNNLLPIVLHLAKAALAAPRIFNFLCSGNKILMLGINLSSRKLFTLALRLNTFKGKYIS